MCDNYIDCEKGLLLVFRRRCNRFERSVYKLERAYPVYSEEVTSTECTPKRSIHNTYGPQQPITRCLLEPLLSSTSLQLIEILTAQSGPQLNLTAYRKDCDLEE